MPSPSANLVTLRPDLAQSLEQYDVAMSWGGFVAQKLLSPVDVASASGNFGIIPLDQLLATRVTTRAPGSGYNRAQFTFKPSTYACTEHGQEEAVDDREAQAYANYLSAEQYATLRARDSVLRDLENSVLGLFTTSNFSGAKTGAVGTTWKTIASSDPVADVKKAFKAVYANSGLIANTVVMGFNAWHNFKLSQSIQNLIKYWGGNDPTASAISTGVAAALLDVNNVIIAGAQKNGAGQGLAASLTQLWSDDNVFVGRVCTTNDFKEPGVGRIFHWAGDGSNIGATVESYRDETVRSNIVRVRMDYDYQIIYPEAGYILTGANA